MTQAPYRLILPEPCTTCVVFASPHSGRDYPDSFLAQTILDGRAIRSSEDAFVDLLFEDAPRFGAPLLAASAPRAFVDLNRSVEELDPALVDGVRRSQLNPRISSGLGVIPRVVSNGRAIYHGKLTLGEAQNRIAQHWRPYHDTLQNLLDRAHGSYGEAILIDLHSMPHEAIEGAVKPGQRRPEIVLGDRFGAACAEEVMDGVERAFQRAGLHVVRNAPFAGAYIAQRYGRPSRRQHAIQVEIDRSLYMNEHMIRPNGNFKSFRRLMRAVMEEIAALGRRNQRLAAE
ncbi:N-formylglutamate amidohydrolase [Brevirhabdus sp.]|uniref:N-formylglutamate amidohydrolase n=1 Tax=Brevirhabdus sp. TaxID=2004514 RepID=UPI004059EFA9